MSQPHDSASPAPNEQEKTRQLSDPKAFQHDFKHDDEGSCSLCYRAYNTTDSNEASETRMLLTCGHAFGKACILTWLEKYNNSCPYRCSKKMLPAIIVQGRSEWHGDYMEMVRTVFPDRAWVWDAQQGDGQDEDGRFFQAEWLESRLEQAEAARARHVLELTGHTAS